MRRPPGQGADFMEAAGIEQRVDPFAHGEAAALVVPRDFVVAAHLVRELLATAQLLELGLPTVVGCHDANVMGQIGSAPVAPLVLPWSLYSAIVRCAMRIMWISSAPSAKRAQRACWYIEARGVSVE